MLPPDFVEAVILAGGTGTRLRSVISEVPKPLAPVRGEPFLSWQLRELEKQGVRRVVLSIGYMAEKIREAIGDRHGGIDIRYVREEEPLGTGGATRLALRKIESPLCFILNGDSFFDVDLAAMEREHLHSGADFTLALKPMDHCGRYGTVKVEEGRVVAFAEKLREGAGLINGGVYLTPSGLLEQREFPARFSLESDFLTPLCENLHFHGHICGGFFIDIGVPEDYLRAQSEPRFLKA